MQTALTTVTQKVSRVSHEIMTVVSLYFFEGAPAQSLSTSAVLSSDL